MQQLTLPEELTVYNVSSCREKLLELLSTENNMKLDCSQLMKIDAAGIQLLLSLVKTSFQENFSFKLVDSTLEVKKTLELIGVKELLIEKREGRE